MREEGATDKCASGEKERRGRERERQTVRVGREKGVTDDSVSGERERW